MPNGLHHPPLPPQEEVSPFWELPVEKLFTQLKSRPSGLTDREAKLHLKLYGLNSTQITKRFPRLRLLIQQFSNPIILILIGAAILSGVLHDATDAAIILAIVLGSGLLGFFQERGALNAVERLLSLVENRSTVLRNGHPVSIPIVKIVPGDILQLKVGDLIPADCRLFDDSTMTVDEASLTGESFPVEKSRQLPPDPTLRHRPDVLLQGTSIASGFGQALVVATGKNTYYSALLEQTRFKPPKTAFEEGVSHFGRLLLKITVVLVLVVFGAHVVAQKPLLDSLLFSLAIAVGIIPQLLPAIISVNLAYGARRLASLKVIVKRLTSLENFGQMEVLCTDKTGTLTVGTASLEGIYSVTQEPQLKASLYAELNARLQSGYVNSLDQAIQQSLSNDLSGWEKISEIPYDFKRKCLSVQVRHGNETILITKGAVPALFSHCDQVEMSDGSLQPLISQQAQLDALIHEKGSQGKRLLGLAYGHSAEERGLIFLGFLEFSDPLKPGVQEVLEALKRQKVQLKIISGDHTLVTSWIGKSVGLDPTAILTGEELEQLSDEELAQRSLHTDLFAMIEPTQKARILKALRQTGLTVGFLGDGVNDTGALHHADVAIAVQNGAPAAKEVADIVLLEKDLLVLQQGILEGRKTFANTMKYVYMATSGNFGSMCTIALSSLLLPFLPLLPKQLLLTNFLCDLPEMALANDHIDDEVLLYPDRWNLSFIRSFLFVFGALSSVADWLTFGAVLWLSQDLAVFRAAWFVESVVTAALAVLVIRTRRFSLSSKPSPLLLVSVVAVVVLTLIFPSTELGTLFGFAPLPWSIYACIGIITLYYLTSIEIGKVFFWKRWQAKLASGNGHGSPSS